MIKKHDKSANDSDYKTSDFCNGCELRTTYKKGRVFIEVMKYIASIIAGITAFEVFFDHHNLFGF